MATVTAGDYTVELDIDREGYRSWYDTQYSKPLGDFENGVAPAHSLTCYLTKQIEEELTMLLQQSSLYEASSGSQQSIHALNEVRIADIVFSFNNSELIKALRARGSCIASQDFNKMREQEAKVNELFNDFDNLTIPVSAYITFLEEDSKIIAMQNRSNKLLLGKQLKFKEASEPTDIIWENRHFTRRDYIIRQLGAYIVMFVLLFGSFVLVFLVAQFSSKIANTYPQVNCDTIEDDYGLALPTYAYDDYEYILANPGQKSSGTLQCFCTNEEQRIGREQAKKTKYPDENGETICQTFFAQVFWN